VDGEALRQHGRAEHRPLQGDGHIGEELRARPVELGPLVGPAPLRLDGAGIGQRGRDLPGGQAQEDPVVVVQTQVRARPEHQRTHRGRLTGEREGEDDGGVHGGLAGGAGTGERGDQLDQIGDRLRCGGGDGRARQVGHDPAGQLRGAVVVDALGGDQPESGGAVEVDQAERAVGPRLPQHPEGGRHGLLRVAVHRSRQAA
jgi:hypothetical protein